MRECKFILRDNTKDLKESRYNPRDITDEKIKTLEKTMKEYGDLGGIVFNVRTGNLIGGHQRTKVLKNSSIKTKPHHDDTGTVAIGYIETVYGKFSYREVDWGLNKELGANLAANKAAGTFNESKQADIFKQLDKDNYDLELTGFDEDEIKNIFEEFGDEDFDFLDEENYEMDEDDSEDFLNENKENELPDEHEAVRFYITQEQKEFISEYSRDLGLNGNSEAIRDIINRMMSGDLS